MINELAHMIGPANASVQISQEMGGGQARAAWVRAVPRPYPSSPLGRLSAAWSVLTGHSHAVRWPKPGDLERALAEGAAPASRRA